MSVILARDGTRQSRGARPAAISASFPLAPRECARRAAGHDRPAACAPRSRGCAAAKIDAPRGFTLHSSPHAPRPARPPLPRRVASCRGLQPARRQRPARSRRPKRSRAEAAAKQFQLPPGFTAQVVASEPDVVQPVAFTTDDRGRLWVLENTNYPNCPGEPRDKILIFEDTDGDGTRRQAHRLLRQAHLRHRHRRRPRRRVGRRAAEPALLPRQKRRRHPDGPPEKLLDGWGCEDTHETINNFTWGPDGWLYGTQGIFTNSKVGAPGTPDKERTPINAGVWRFHPTKKKFELYAEGASNQWGIDWNDHGQAFFEACVIPHMWQCIQGARYHRQAGQHFNKFTYEDIKTIADFSYEKRAYCGAMVYLGGQWPAEYRNTLFLPRHPHEQAARRAHGAPRLRLQGGAAARFPRLARRLVSRHRHAIRPGRPVFVIDWYDKVPCHQQRDFTDRATAASTSSCIKARSRSASICKRRATPNSCSISSTRTTGSSATRAASCRSAGRSRKSTPRSRKSSRENPDDTRQLRALWALHGTGGFTEALALEDARARRANTSARGPSSSRAKTASRRRALLAEFARLAKDDPSPVVRLYLASAAQRIAIKDRWPILTALAAHGEDAKDQNLPLMIWYAAEPAVAADVAKAAELLAACKIPKVQEFITRRIAAAATANAE